MNELTPGVEGPVRPLAAGPWRRVSWGAIWAGMFVTVILTLMFTLLGVVCGIASLNPLSRSAAAHGGLSIGAAIWLMISWLVAMWVGAQVAGWMSGGPRRADGTVHGLVAWSFAAAVILLLLTGTASALLGSSTSGVVVVNPGNFPGLAGTGPGAGRGLAPTGRSGEQAYQYSQNAPGANAGAGPGQSSNAGAGQTQPLWGTALFSFLALVLGLGVAAWGGASGAASADRSLRGAAA